MPSPVWSTEGQDFGRGRCGRPQRKRKADLASICPTSGRRNMVEHPRPCLRADRQKKEGGGEGNSGVNAFLVPGQRRRRAGGLLSVLCDPCGKQRYGFWTRSGTRVQKKKKGGGGAKKMRSTVHRFCPRPGTKREEKPFCIRRRKGY